jgi:hypothetical protein
MNKYINIETIGKYDEGLTEEEIKEYLITLYEKIYKRKCQKSKIRALLKRFNKIAGINTMTLSPDGEPLMFRWDVERFAGVLFFNKETYWD